MNYVEENFMHLLDNLSDQIKILRMLKKNIEKKKQFTHPRNRTWASQEMQNNRI